MNNRQNGRRRGRSNQRPQGQGRSNDQGNRIDSRARGNATQLLEKYRNMARDAQLSGDRVMTEYYLQFADHYFRVLSDARTRQEEQRGRYEERDDGRDYPRDGGQDDGREAGQDGAEDGDDTLDPIDSIGRAPRRFEREPRRDGRDNGYNGNNGSNGNRQGNRADTRGQYDGDEDDDAATADSARTELTRTESGRADSGRADHSRGDARRGRDDRPAPAARRPERQAERSDDMPRRPRPERGNRDRFNGNGGDDDAVAGIDLAVLPPAIGIESAAPSADTDHAAEAEAKPKRRGRPRKVVSEGDEAVA